MPSKEPLQRLRDIQENIERIEGYTEGLDASSFIQDHKSYDAVERCLERISEAAKKLGDLAEELCPGVPWPKLRALGNFLRHEYDRVDRDRVWFMVERDLQPLKGAVDAAIRRHRDDNA